MTLAGYAREHGLSRHTLYVARKRLQVEEGATAKRQGNGRGKAAQNLRFVPVQLAATSAPLLRVRLPNGVTMEFGPIEASAYAGLLSALVALPCSN